MSADQAGGHLGDPAGLRTVHVVGIGGAGMSAIATVLSAMGHTVTGSDLKSSGITDRLSRAGIHVEIGHRAGNLGAADLVTALQGNVGSSDDCALVLVWRS